MAENWEAPGSKHVKITYKVIQYSTGEWAIVQTEEKTIAWFANRAQAINCCNSLLPMDAKRER